MKRKLFLLATLTLLAALLLSGTAFAEGEVEQPDAPAAPAVEAPAAPEAQTPAVEPAGAPAVDEAPVADPAPDGLVEETPAEVVEAAADEVASPAAEGVNEPLVEAAPEVLVVDAAGEPLDMASQASAEILSSADPYFFVGKTQYMFLKNGQACPDGTLGITCWNSLPDGNPIQDAINYIRDTSGLKTDGKIYVEYADYAGNVAIDGSAGNSYLIKGLFGLANTNGDFPTIGGSVSINNLYGGFTLSGFTITGGVSITDSAGNLVLQDLDVSNPTGSGIEVGWETSPGNYFAHSGNVTVQNVKSSNNPMGYGAEVYAVGNVKVVNSSFDNNNTMAAGSKAGLRIMSFWNSVTLDGVTASGNNGYGARILSQKTLTIKNSAFNNNTSNTGTGLLVNGGNKAAVTFDTVFANGNYVGGINLYSSGAVTLANIEARDNRIGDGLSVNHTGSSALVKVTNGRFIHNARDGSSGNGLTINSLGSVLLTSITASENRAEGLYVDNCQYDSGLGKCLGNGTVTITSPTAAGEDGANAFDKNLGRGVYVKSSGAVTLTNFSSESNSMSGVRIDNQYGKGGVTINETLPYDWRNSASSNLNYGIYLITNGFLNLSGTNVDGNTYHGLTNDDTYKLAGAAIKDSSFSYNDYSGLLLATKGSATLINVDAYWNQGGNGVAIDATSGSGTVTIKGSKPYWFNYYGYNSENGIYIRANNTVAVSDVNAESNDGTGIRIVNDFTGLAKPVTVARVNAKENGSGGIAIETAGSVVLDNVHAYENPGGSGASVDACVASGLDCLNTANVTLKGYNTFDNNGTRGLEIETKGAITISKADASGNGGSGVFLNNDYAGATAGITLGSSRYYSSINGNGGIDPGLDIRTRGTISLTNVSVSDNENGPGASLNNTNAAKPRAVTITDGNFYNNFETGLLLLNINGPITLRGVSAGYNGDGSPNDAYGIFVLNHTGGNVVVTSSKWQGSQFDGNKNTGLWIDTTGMVTLSNLEASYNGRYGGFGHGVYIDADGNVSVSNKRSDQLTTFSGNNLNGLEIISLGTISVTNGVEANDNGSYGILLNNTNFSGSKTITANKLTTNGNGDTGLIVYGTGLVNLANLKSCNNTINGVYVHDSAGRTGNVTLTGTNLMTGNHYRGLVIYTTKKVSVSGVTANLNEESGIEIWNSTGVTVRNSTANQNKNGLYIHANGNVVVDKVKSFGNSASGSYIYSYGFNVTLQNSAFIGNQMYGIEIEDLGAGVPTLKNTLYAGNGTQDLVIH